MQPMLTPLIDL